MEWEGDNLLLGFKLLFPFLCPELEFWTSLRAAPRAQHQGRQVAGKPLLESLQISLTAVGEVKSSVKPTKQ